MNVIFVEVHALYTNNISMSDRPAKCKHSAVSLLLNEVLISYDSFHHAFTK